VVGSIIISGLNLTIQTLYYLFRGLIVQIPQHARRYMKKSQCSIKKEKVISIIKIGRSNSLEFR